MMFGPKIGTSVLKKGTSVLLRSYGPAMKTLGSILFRSHRSLFIKSGSSRYIKRVHSRGGTVGYGVERLRDWSSRSYGGQKRYFTLSFHWPNRRTETGPKFFDRTEREKKQNRKSLFSILIFDKQTNSKCS